MTNATALAMVSHLDNLVLDYVQRRPKFAVGEAGPFHATAGPENLKFAPIGGLTLEKVYCFYFSCVFPSRGISKRSLQMRLCLQEVSKHKIYANERDFTIFDVQEKSHNTLLYDVAPKLDSDTRASRAPFLVPPSLPSEVVEQIFELGEVKQLFSLRELSRRINKIVSERICRQAAKVVRVNKLKSAVQFSKFFKERIVGLGSIFGAYYFEEHHKAARRVLTTVGRQLRFAAFDTESFSLAFLSQMPNVENLSLTGRPNPCNYKNTTLQLTKLKYLTFTEDWPVRHPVTLDYMTFWTKLAPNLRELNFAAPHPHSRGNTDSVPQLLQFFCAHKHLNKISCWKHSISRKNGEMEVSLFSDSGEALVGVYKDLSSPSESPRLLPPLRHVTLHEPKYIYFGNSVFETVRVFSLFFSNWERFNENLQFPYDCNFPRLTTLHLQGNFYVKNLNCFVSNVSNLKFSGFDRTTSRATNIFDVQVVEGQPNGIGEWPISKFKNLKTLEFECKESLCRTVLDIVWLTISGHMQPLQKLTITYCSSAGESLVEERNLFYSLRHLEYHKELNFKITHPSTKFS